MSRLAEINLQLHPKQGEALTTTATEVLYGGAAGGGKSHLMRAAAILWCSRISGLQVYLFRRIRDDLVKNHVEGPKGLRALLAPWALAGLVSIVEDEIRFWNGSKIYLCHCKDEKDRYKYLGAEIHVLLIDELTTFTEVIYRFLRGRVRAVGLSLPGGLEGLFPRILCGSNPGNIGHLWVKQAFIDSARPLAISEMPDSEGGMRRQYVPARLEDNPSMATDDPNYRARLRGLGSEALVKAMEEGDWNIIEGAYFDCWQTAKHVIRPFEIPAHWLRFRSGDWGSAKPFSFGWWGVASEDFQHPDGQTIPRGALVRYREWYGVKRGADGLIQPNVGLKLHAEAVGKGLAEREAEISSYGVLDPSAFAQDGGPSIAERIYTGSGKKVIFRRADNSRIARNGAMGGWDQLRGRLVGDEEDRPMIYCFSTCIDSIRTIPVLQHDPDRPEDILEGEDHAGDDWRYACLSRPYVRPAPSPPKGIRTIHDATLDELWDLQRKQTGKRI
jgi:hypothetical protein